MNKIKTTRFVCPDSMENWQSARELIKSKLLNFIGRPLFKIKPTLNFHVHEKTECEKYTRTKISYGNKSDDPVWAWLLVPKDFTGKLPAVICLPGSYMTANWGKDAVVGLAGPQRPGTPENYGEILAKKGFIALCPDYPCAGERVKPELSPYDTSDIDARFPQWTRVGMSLWDISRAIEVLKKLKYVNTKKLGIMGNSQGGEMSVMAGGFYDEISTVVSICGWSPFAGKNIQGLAEQYNYPKLNDYDSKGKTLDWDFDHLAALIAPKPFLNISGTHDRYFPNQKELHESENQIRKLYGLNNSKDNFKTIHLDQDHSCSWAAMHEALDWFENWLK